MQNNRENLLIRNIYEIIRGAFASKKTTGKEQEKFYAYTEVLKLSLNVL